MNSDRNSSAQKRTKAMNFATMRAVVAGYLVYLGGSLIYDYLKSRSGMTPLKAWGFGLLFIAAGVGYGLYAWKRWQAETASAQGSEDSDRS